jgi:hypothetical protein
LLTLVSFEVATQLHYHGSLLSSNISDLSIYSESGLMMCRDANDGMSYGFSKICNFCNVTEQVAENKNARQSFPAFMNRVPTYKFPNVAEITDVFIKK